MILHYFDKRSSLLSKFLAYLSGRFGSTSQVTHFSLAPRQVEQQVDSQLLEQLILLLTQLSRQLLAGRQPLDGVLVPVGGVLEPVSSV